MSILKKRTFYIIAIFLSLIFAIGVSSFSANAASTVNIELILPEDWAGISFTLEEETVDGLGIREDVPVGSNGIAVFEGEESSNYSITCNESNIPKMSNEIAIQTKTVSPEGGVTISIDFGKEWAGSVFSCYTDEETYDECYRTNTKGVLEVTVEKSDNYIICYALASGESVIDNVLNGNSAGGSTTTAQVSNNTQVSPSASPENTGGVTIIGSESPASTSNDTPESASSEQVNQGNGESSTDPSASPTSVRDIINNAKNDNQSGVANDPNSSAEPNGTITNPDGDSGAGAVTIIIIVIAVLLIAAGIFGVVTLRKRNDSGSKKDKAAKKDPAKTKKVSGFAGLNHSTKNKAEKKTNKGKSVNKKSSSKNTTGKSAKPKKQSSKSKTGTVHTKKNTQHVEQNVQHTKKTVKNAHTNQHTNKNTRQVNRKQDIQKNKKPRNNNDTVYEQDDLEEIIDDENFNENIIIDSREFEDFEENKDEQFNVEFESPDDMIDDELEIDNDDDYEDEFVGDDEFPDNLNIIEEENEEEDEIESKKYNNSRKSQIAQEEEKQYEDEYLIEDESEIPSKTNKNSRQRRNQSAEKTTKNTESGVGKQDSQQRDNHTQAKNSNDDLSKQKEQKQTGNKDKIADEGETVQLQKPTRGKRVRKRGTVIEPVEQKGTLDWSDNPKKDDNSANSETVKNETNQAKTHSEQNVLNQSENVEGKAKSNTASDETDQSQPHQRTRTRARKQAPVQDETPQEAEQPKRTRTRGKKKNNNQQ